MARIIIACGSETARGQLNGMLASSGHSVFRCCASGSELRRAMTECDDGIVVFVSGLPGCKVEELYWDYGNRTQILLIGRPPALAECEVPEIFRLALPASGQAVVGAVEMLSQLHQMRLPKRTGTDKQTVEQAKQVLMRRLRVTEPEAHRMLQQYAMNHGVRMTEYAAQIIREDGG